jgi:hypothetical protein
MKNIVTSFLTILLGALMLSGCVHNSRGYDRRGYGNYPYYGNYPCYDRRNHYYYNCDQDRKRRGEEKQHDNDQDKHRGGEHHEDED